MQSGTFVASLVVWQEGQARSFDCAQALRPVNSAYDGTINSLPVLLDRICLSRFAILEKVTPRILPKLSDYD